MNRTAAEIAEADNYELLLADAAAERASWGVEYARQIAVLAETNWVRVDLPGDFRNWATSRYLGELERRLDWDFRSFVGTDGRPFVMVSRYELAEATGEAAAAVVKWYS